MDARNCQTSTVAPAETGVFPFVINYIDSGQAKQPGVPKRVSTLCQFRCREGPSAKWSSFSAPCMNGSLGVQVPYTS
jgi:hypothetical protein